MKSDTDSTFGAAARGPFVLAASRSRRPSQGRSPGWRERRNLSGCPLTAATCERLVSTKDAHSRFFSPRSAMMKESRCGRQCAGRGKFADTTVVRCASWLRNDAGDAGHRPE